MERSKYFPVPNYTKSFWLTLEDRDPFSRFKSSESLPKETDIVIIGSGYAGTSTAHFLLQENPNLDICLYEARTICSGATGRNGGHLKPYFHRLYADYERDHGQIVAAQVVNSEVETLYAVKKLVEDESIDCDFILTRACDVYKDEKRVEYDLKSYHKMMANPYVSEEVKKSIQLVMGENVEMMSKVPGAKLCFTYPAAHLWPWKLTTALLKKCVSRGLKLYSNTPAHSVKKLPNGKWVVRTPRGDTVCNKVIFATNGYTKALLESFKDVIVPIKGIVTYIKPHSKKELPQLPNTYGIFSRSGLQSDYLINRIDGSTIVGGSSHLMISPDGSSTGIFDNNDDSTVPDASKAYLKDYMEKTFYNWKSTPTKNEMTWSGILGFTNDKFPYVGELDSIGMPGCFIIAGFHGHGMPRVFLSGKAVAGCVLSGKSIKEIGNIPECYFMSKQRMQVRPHSYKKEIENHIKEFVSPKPNL